MPNLTWTVGDARITRVVEVEAQLPMEEFLPQATPGWTETVERHLHYYAAFRGIAPERVEQSVERVVRRFGLTNMRTAQWNQLSDGQRVRFHLARLMVWRPKLMVSLLLSPSTIVK